MKKASALLLTGLIALIVLVLMQACRRDKYRTVTYKVYHSVIVQKSDILGSINGKPGEPLTKAGQIYLSGSLILLNDVDKGIHIYDNSDPAHPTQLTFLNIPGNQNIAMRGNTLYADAYSGLLAINLTNIKQPKVLGVNWNIFASRGYTSDTSAVVMSYVVKDTTVTLPVTTPIGPTGGPILLETFAASMPSASSGAGTGGSEAAMTLIGNYLYAIPNPHCIGVIDISNPAQLKLDTVTYGAYDLETVFPIQDKLFCGSKEGVFIYSVADPANPKQIGEFMHGRACDPVVADQKFAFVTLHSGSYCGGSENELDVLSAQDLTSSTLVKTYSMSGPLGLGKDGNVLFVCDGPGVKVYDATDPTNLRLTGILPVEGAYDVIAANNLLIVGGKRGLFEFDYTNTGHIRPLGAIAMNQE